MKNVKSPLRYPGGKSRAITQILPIVPEYNEFREPFVGGGSVFFALKQLYPEKKYWINDLNNDLYCFWKACQEDMESLLSEIWDIKANSPDGRFLYQNLIANNVEITDLQRAVRFFVLNRITFSGTVESGGYSEQAFKRRFTDSSIERVEQIEEIIQDVTITNIDYEEIIHASGNNVFIFLDPPYLSTAKSKLYGKEGDLHSIFEHERFAENMKKCHHKWLITYDNSDEVIDLFSFANIYEWELQYGMNNYKQDKASKGKELFISNYEILSLSNRQIITSLHY